MILFCCEMVEWVYKGMFNKHWKKEDFVRTVCYRAAAASKILPNAPSSITAKAAHLGNVPWNEHW